jgi:hypothetical protein
MALIGSPCIGSPIFSPNMASAMDVPVLQHVLVLTQQPSTVAGSHVFLPQQPIVAAQFGGITDSHFTGVVTVTANQLTGTFSYTGTPTIAFVNGVATFGPTDARVDGAGTGTLTFSAPGAKPVTSNVITVS